MKFWFDCEFIERGPDYPIELLSIGIVAEDGRELYRQAGWTPHSHANEWVREHVLPQLVPCPIGLPIDLHRRSRSSPYPVLNLSPTPICTADDCVTRSREDLAQEIIEFCDPKQYGKPEFWAYYADYDWVVLCQIFGTMMELPMGWPMYCRDIKQEADRLESWIRGFNSAPEYKLRLPAEGEDEHHALADARWNRKALDFLDSIAGTP